MKRKSDEAAPVLDSNVEACIRISFERQPFMKEIGAQIEDLGPGKASIALPYRPTLGQQFGNLHAGVTTAIADTACGYAAFTLLRATIVSVEFKVNLLAPAKGERFVACAEVVKSGRSLAVCRADVWACEGESRNLIAMMQATMMPLKK
jgi:uncharacterized protein (TIGR00369 family)